MKISINLFTLLFLSVTGIAQNYDNKINTVNSRKEHTQAIKLNLLSPFYGTLNLSWQKVLSNEGSFQLTASYTDFDSYGSTENTKENDYNSQTTYSVNGNMTTETSVYNTVKSQRTQGFVLTPEYRYLLNGRNLTGIYVAPFMRYMYY